MQNSDLYLELMMNSTMVHRLDIVRYLLEEGVIDVNAQTEAGVTTLMVASRYNATDIAEYLLEMGADPNVLSRNNNNETNEGIPEWMPRNENQDNSVTALMLASVNCDNLDIVNRLLEAGADPYGQNRSGETAILWVLTRNHSSYNCLIMLSV